MREQGTAFGSYLLIKRLARGGMAEVFLARQRGPEGFDRQVAVKRILPHLADSEDFVTQFHDEARLAARLSHPNVVHIYEFGQVEDHYFITMEYVDGVHAGALIEHGAIEPMPPALVARIGADACAGLNYAHRLSDDSGRPLHLVHRDISPPNLMISFDGVVKLVDFGIAKAVNMMNKTRPGIVKGKFAYMSPEQTMGKRLDGRSDVFSLALVCWELLAGRVALDRTDPVEAMKCIRDGKLPLIRQVRPDTPPPLAHILEQALAVKPTARLSALDLGNALEGYIKSSPELGTSMQLSEWVRSRFHDAPAGGDQSYQPAAGYAPVDSPMDAPMDSPLDAPMDGRRAPTRPAAAGESAASTGGGAPAFDPKASFLQEVDDDDALTQITSQPTHPARAPSRSQRARLPEPNATLPPAMGQGRNATLPPAMGQGPNATLPPMMSQGPGATMPPMMGQGPGATMPPMMGQGPNATMPPAMSPMGMTSDSSWARFTGATLLQTRRRLVIAVVATVIVLIVIALAMSSNESAPATEAPSDNAATAGDAGAVDGMGESGAAPDAGPRADDTAEGNEGNQGNEDNEDSAAAARTAWLEVITRPAGALVTLDDRDPIESPAVFEDLETGEHAIAIEHDGYRDVESTVTLEPGVKTLEFDLEREASRTTATRKGMLSVVTRPSSRVYMGKRKLDSTPFANKRLKPGTYTLTFKKPGYQTVKKKVTIRPGETSKLNFALRKR